jgi:hypothetical protein
MRERLATSLSVVLLVLGTTAPADPGPSQPRPAEPGGAGNGRPVTPDTQFLVPTLVARFSGWVFSWRRLFLTGPDLISQPSRGLWLATAPAGRSR